MPNQSSQNWRTNRYHRKAHKWPVLM